MNVRNIINKTVKNFKGWRTSRKIVVFESDDWGSIRMPSRAIYEKCIKKGYRVDENLYERYDSLESEDDLDALFHLLSTYRDKNGFHPVITANCLVANPDFEKILASNYNQYFNESVLETFKKYPNHSNCFEMWKNGKDNRLFYPQYHGREHLNVSRFMESLQRRDPDALFGFDNKMPGCISLNSFSKGNFNVEATYYNSLDDKKEKIAIYLDGLKNFERLLGYQSKSMIAPNYTWSRDFDCLVYERGVEYFQGNLKMREPGINKPDYFYSSYLGQQNNFGQLNLIRNCSFEPSLSNQLDPVSECLKEIRISFLLHKPAIISTHRVNFIGGIDENNRKRTLYLFENLILQMLKTWPDIEFLRSDELGDLIKYGKC